MFKYIFSIFKTYSSKNIILQNLVLLAIIMLLLMTYNNRHLKFLTREHGSTEGFAQKDAFVLKQNDEIYDEFYAGVYDTIHDTIKRSQWELRQLLKLTDADTNNSTILDVGSGTGYIVNELQHAGYRAYGIDNSESMVKQSTNKYPDIVVKKADVLDPMNYEKLTFTHILCLNFTIYEFKNKSAFFRNCHLWMMPNTYLVLHLVNPAKFKAVMPVDEKNKWSTAERVTDSLADFYDFNYRAQYEFPATATTTNNQIVLKETFKDKETNHIRQNERVMYMENINDILKLANIEGFVFHGKTSTEEYNGDDNQYLYVLERVM